MNRTRAGTHSALLLSLLFVFVLFAVPFSSEAGQSTSLTQEPPRELKASTVVSLTNKARKESLLAPLTKDRALMRAAKRKASDMAQKGYFSHTTPSGKEFTYFVDMAGYDYTRIGENIAVHFMDEKAAVTSWLNSKPHRENILNPAYTHIGVGLAYGTLNGRSGWFGVQLFGTP